MRIALLRVVALMAVSLAAAPAFAQAPVFDWSGFYAGVQGGFGSSTATTTGTLDYTSNGKYHWGNPHDWRNQPHSWSKSVSSSSDATPEFGAFAGYNFQFANGLVIGGETDINWSGDRTTGEDYLKIIPHHCHNFCMGGYDLTTTTDWYGTARLRVGQSIGQLLLYGTGGLAYGDVTSSGGMWMQTGWHHFHDSFDESGIRVGWAAGAGAELAINERVSVKLEYLHIDLGSKDLISHAKKIDLDGHGPCDPGKSTVTGSLKNALAIDTIRVGLALHF